MAVGDLFLSALIKVLFEQLLSPDLLKFARRERISEKLDKWRKTLSRITTMLDDAEDRQHNDRAVKQWLDDLKDLAYDVEDILDEFSTEVLRRALMGETQASTSKARNLIPACCTGLTPSVVKINIKLGSKITEITNRFHDIVTQTGDLNLREKVNGRTKREKERTQPTSVMNEARICGREKDKENVLKLLLTENRSVAGVGVIPILGMAGIGKTTLAQLVYNDKKVLETFEVRAWACVSEDFDVGRITKAVLESVGTSANYYGKDLNWLQVKLKEILHGKKFLVTLDDVWNESYQDWTTLLAPFEAGVPGSRILITTRNQKVSSMMGTVNGPVYPLQLLSDDVCLSILSLNALDARDFSAFPDLKDIGEDIAKKCKGLPLAATLIGGLLRTNQGCEKWKEVLRSGTWDKTAEESGIVPALMLSYYHLPSHLKRCFAYCSIFPKDYEFQEQQLVLLWMAEGFIQHEEGEKQMEDFGREYFCNLVSRSFFQKSSNNESRFVMHDLINDLAQMVAGDTCFRVEDNLGSSNKYGILKKARHSSYLADRYDGMKRFGAFFDCAYLRTFISLRFQQPYWSSFLTRYVPHELLPKLRCLRVLTLSGYKNLFELPHSIGVLKHLRYVDLSYTPIESLPESLTTLYNLQTLLLEKCEALKKLPFKFEMLVNLRHLNLKGASLLEGMPPRISRLTCLQTLSDLVVGEASCSGIQELGPLSHLGGTLRISKLENVIEVEDAKDANLIDKTKVHCLVLEWSQNRTRDEFEVLNILQPNNSLKELTIKHYGGTQFPTWLRGPSFPDMVLLRIENCKSCASLPPVGQLPSLKHLFIVGMAAVKNVGPEFYGENSSQGFKSLVTLSFEDMTEWEYWIPGGEFQHLRHLSVSKCPKLSGKFPCHFPSLEEVTITGCGNFVVSFSSFPELCQVQIDSSKAAVGKNKVDFSSLAFISPSTISKLTCGVEGFNMEGLTNVEDLYIWSCGEMTSLWSNEVGLVRHLPRLRVLEIRDCPSLVSLVAEKVLEEQLYSGSGHMVKEIRINNCNALQSLPKSMMYSNRCLECVELYRCDSLTHFARDHLPPTLKRLRIAFCTNLLILLDGDDIDIDSGGWKSLLERLVIEDCRSVKCLTLSGELPATLQHLRIMHCGQLESIANKLPQNSFLEEIWIWDCDNLKSLPVGVGSLTHLHEIYISGCPNLALFADRESLPANLRQLALKSCDKMQHLPNNIRNLTSLRELTIKRCPVLSFPEEGFPTNLTSLDISALNINEAVFDWGLHNLASLKELYIVRGSPHLISFPEMLLPASLTRLVISGFPNLEYLSSKGFQKLASLEELWIFSCGKLTSLPKHGLPPTILDLAIKDCPLLIERCKKERQEWSKIAHIPCVHFDGEVFKF